MHVHYEEFNWYGYFNSEQEATDALHAEIETWLESHLLADGWEIVDSYVDENWEDRWYAEYSAQRIISQNQGED